MSTDIAEFLGGAIGLNLLFGVPLFLDGLMTGAIAFGLLGLHRFRRGTSGPDNAFALAVTGR